MGKVKNLFSDEVGPNVQRRPDNDKYELKEYTKEAVRHRDRLEIVEKITSKQFAHDETHAAGSEKWIRTLCLSMCEYRTMIVATFNVLPGKIVLTTWARQGKIHWDNYRERSGKRSNICFFNACIHFTKQFERNATIKWCASCIAG